MFSRKFFETNFTEWEVDVLEEGRIAALRMLGPSGNLQIYNVHLDHSGIAKRLQNTEPNRSLRTSSLQETGTL